MYAWLAPHLVFPLYERLTGRHPWTTMRRLQQLQWLPAEVLEARALTRLRSLLEHAAVQVPYYRALFQRVGFVPGELRSIADLVRIPASTKADLRAVFPDGLLAANLPPSRRIALRTSGSSGTPFVFYMDRADLDGVAGSHLFFHDWAGARIWEPRLRIQGMVEKKTNHNHLSRAAPWLRRAAIGEEIVPVRGMDLDLDLLQRMVGRVAKRGAYSIVAYPSYAARLGSQLLAAGAELAAYPRVVIAGAETLTDADAATIERAFRCRVVNRYGAWEVPNLAQTCPDDPSRLHVNSERAILRIVREDGTLASPGERGRILLTHLANDVMPLINYDIGDWAIAAGPCGCGRGFPTVQALEGRTMELLRLPNGKVLSTAAFSALLTLRYPVIPYVQEYQAVQESLGRIVLRVVPTARFNSDFAATLQGQLETFLGPDLRMAIEPVEHIEAEASGKRLTIKTSLPAAD